VLDDDTEALEVTPRDVCREVVRRARDPYPDADIAVDAAPKPGLSVRSAVLGVVLWNLVENALEHGGDDVGVRVAVRIDDDGVRFVVADDGPGVPEAELESVRSGTETALTHGSGLGLWVVRWGTRLLGADLAFDDPGTSGTTVTVTLPGSVVVADGDADTVDDADGDVDSTPRTDAPAAED